MPRMTYETGDGPRPGTEPTHVVRYGEGALSAPGVIYEESGLWLRGPSGAWSPFRPHDNDFRRWRFEPALSVDEEACVRRLRS